MNESYKLLEVFPCCAAMRELCGGLETVSLTGVTVEREALAMTVNASFARMPAPAELAMLQSRLRAEYGLRAVEIVADYPRPKPAAPAGRKKSGEKKKSAAGDVLMGKGVRGETVPIGSLTAESGEVTIEGEIEYLQYQTRRAEKGGLLQRLLR